MNLHDELQQQLNELSDIAGAMREPLRLSQLIREFYFNHSESPEQVPFSVVAFHIGLLASSLESLAQQNSLLQDQLAAVRAEV